jgi:putative PIN family toxin of toxin-antitoxin system
MSEAIHVVYDCMIFLQAAARPDRIHGTMQLVRDSQVSLCMSPAIIAELRDVLTRPEVRAKFPALKPHYVGTFLNEVLSRSKIMNNVPGVFSLPRDKKDEPYTDLAIAAGAKYLVTWNDRHLAYLMRQDTSEGVEFCRRFPSLKIVDPPTFLEEIRQAGLKTS